MTCKGCIHRKIIVVPISNGTSGSVEWCTLWGNEAVNRCSYYMTWWDRIIAWFHGA